MPSQQITEFGNKLSDTFHYLALFAIGALVVWSAGVEYLRVVGRGSARIDDILLLFIYLELGAMVGIYFKTRKLPVRFLIYVAITALTRMLVGIIQADHELLHEMKIEDLPVMPLVWISVAILVLAGANLVIRFGSHRYPAQGLEGDITGLEPED